MRLAVDDDLLDGQVLRLVGSAVHGGADVQEVLTSARTIDPADLGTWYTAFTALADQTLAQAPTNDDGSALSAGLRASNYYRAAGQMFIAAPVDHRLVQSNIASRDAFAKALALIPGAEAIQIPYEQTTLPGYFFAASDQPGPTLILTGGYDSSAEELYFFSGKAALERGYHVLAFDGPGQGAALIQQGLTLRPDWENVIGPVIDYAITRAEVDPQRIGLVGLSLGAHLAPRAASGEHRLAACVADCGTFDMYAMFLDRLPPVIRPAFEAGDKDVQQQVGQMLNTMAQEPTAGWTLRRGMLVHGADTALDYVLSTRDYSLQGRAQNITCPTFVCNAQNDPIGASAPQLVAALTCPHEFVTFTGAAAEHCESGARLQYDARVYSWLAGVLQQ